MHRCIVMPISGCLCAASLCAAVHMPLFVTSEAAGGSISASKHHDCPASHALSCLRQPRGSRALCRGIKRQRRQKVSNLYTSHHKAMPLSILSRLISLVWDTNQISLSYISLLFLTFAAPAGGTIVWRCWTASLRSCWICWSKKRVLDCVQLEFEAV